MFHRTIDKILSKDIFNTKSTDGQEGSGLGIGIVSSFLNENNSFLEINSHAGKGSEFVVKIPLPGN